MVMGIGSDLVDIRRIERLLERFGNRFVGRVFTETERAHAERRVARAATYAKRFAAKEACAKALGTGLRGGVHLRDLGVVSLATGQPTIALTGGARRRLDDMTPAGMEARIDVTLADEPPLAHATVLITASPAVAAA